jgi:hypothetical protein
MFKDFFSAIMFGDFINNSKILSFGNIVFSIEFLLLGKFILLEPNVLTTIISFLRACPLRATKKKKRDHVFRVVWFEF